MIADLLYVRDEQRGGLTAFRLSVLVPVYNERHVVEASLRRVLALNHELISGIELIVVDDCSNDGTWEVLERVASEDERVLLVRHDRNRGKGAAIRTALTRATGDISIVHDADLEYDPGDIPALLLPFAEAGADATFGSRYLSAPYRRALMHRHTMINKALTFVSNWFTDLNLTDLETCYKAINTTLLKSIPIRSDDFRFEVEIAFKLAKRRAHVFEVPIRYLPRTYREGKKIRMRDGVLALLSMIRFWLIDDMFKKDEYGSYLLVDLERARRLNLWMADTLRPFLGDSVLEIGAGIGTLTNQFIPRELYVASDTNPHYLHYLRSYSFRKPYLQVARIDVDRREDLLEFEQRFDTVLFINGIAGVEDEHLALAKLRTVLKQGGRLILMAPNHPGLYGTLDAALEYRRRYSANELRRILIDAGFRVENIFDFNRVSVPGWWINGKLLRRSSFSRIQLKAMDTAMPILRRMDRLWPWSGLSLAAIAVKDQAVDRNASGRAANGVGGDR